MVVCCVEDQPEVMRFWVWNPSCEPSVLILIPRSLASVMLLSSLVLMIKEHQKKKKQKEKKK
jgi:hypothetical protein